MLRNSVRIAALHACDCQSRNHPSLLPASMRLFCGGLRKLGPASRTSRPPAGAALPGPAAASRGPPGPACAASSLRVQTHGRPPSSLRGRSTLLATCSTTFDCLATGLAVEHVPCPSWFPRPRPREGLESRRLAQDVYQALRAPWGVVTFVSVCTASSARAPQRDRGLDAERSVLCFCARL